MKNKAFHGTYKAQEGDVRVEFFPASRRPPSPAMEVISRRAAGQWERVDGGLYSERKAEKWTSGLKLAGTRGTTHYYRKLA